MSSPTRKPPPTLSDTQAPEYLSQAALRAHRKWNDPEHRDKILKQRGSPGFKPTRAQAKQVELMAAMGLNPREIGACLGIEKELVTFYYSYEIRTALHRVNVAVGKVALEAALSGNDYDMTRFWLQTRAGWSPKSTLDVSGVDKDADEARAAREKLLQGDDVPDLAEGGTSSSSGTS